MAEHLEAWQLEDAAKEKGRELAKQVEDEMNHCPYNENFAESFISYLVHNTHPYLRNEIFNKLILGVVQEMAVSSQHDPRDVAAYKTAKYIKDKMDTAYEKEHVNIVSLPHPSIKTIAERSRGCWYHSEGCSSKSIYATHRDDLEDALKQCQMYHLITSDIKKNDKGYFFTVY